MSSSAPKRGYVNSRSISLVLLSLLVIYSVFGVFFVPKIVESQLSDNLKKYAKWNTHIEQINFHPFAISLELKGAEVTELEGSEVLRFERLFVDFSVLDALKGDISFEEISLTNPVINLGIDETGTTNFQRAFASDTPEPDLVEEEAQSAPLALSFQLIAIHSGVVNINDQSQGEPFEFSLSPLDISLEAFSTHHNEGGLHHLHASLANNQEIEWQGQIGIAPFQSSGQIRLKNIHSNTFWHYAKKHSPYWLQNANITFTGNYSTLISDTETLFSLDKTALVIDDLILAESEDTATFFSVNQLSVAPIQFDLAALDLKLGDISIKQPNLAIERFVDENLNILRPLQAQAESEPPQEIPEEEANITTIETGEEVHSPVFKWQISRVALSNGTVLWRDQIPSSPVEIGVSDLDLEIGKLSEDLSQAFPYDLRFSLNDDEQNKVHQINGQLSPQPFSIEGKAHIDQFALRILQPYLSENTHLVIEQGTFSTTTNYKLALADELHGSISLETGIDQLSLRDSVLNKPLGSFQQLDIGPVVVDLPESKANPIKVVIDTITLDQPQGDLFIAQDGELNLNHLVKNNAPSELVVEEPETQTEDKQSPPTEISLGQFILKNGTFSYTDDSLKPAFTTQLSSLNGSIENLSSDVTAKSKVDFSGKVDTQGKLAIRGTLNPLSAEPNTDLNIQVNNVNMSIASPYSAKYAGYLIDKGKLDLDLNYLIQSKKLKAENAISLEQFQFGKSVDSPDATSLPLPLAVGILKDLKGNIEIDLPISGDLNDPSFKLSSVVINTFVNLITKAVTSPFSILGSLVEGKDDISEIEFAANSAELVETQKKRVLALSKALKKRPNLTLEIRGIADANLEQLSATSSTNSELIKLAKSRAQVLHDVLINEGNIDEKRVFILESEVLAKKTSDKKTDQATESSDKIITVSSKFTLGVR